MDAGGARREHRDVPRDVDVDALLRPGGSTDPSRRGADGTLTSMICRPVAPSATYALLSRTTTSHASPGVSSEPTFTGVTGLVMSMILSPEAPSAT